MSKPKSDLSLHNDVSCIICGDQNYTPIWKQEEKQIVCCQACNFYYHFPQLPIQDYDKEYHKQRQDYYDKKLDLSRIDQILKYKKSGKLLDIGCGFGKFLSLAKTKGFDIVGLEVSDFACKIAQRNTGSEVVGCSIEQANFEYKSFDIITMWHVLEHLKNPFNILHKIKNYLKDDGLLIIEVPNEFNSLISKIVAIKKGSYIPYTLPPTHLWYFCPKTISKLMSKTGYDVLEVKTLYFESSNSFYKKYWLIRPLRSLLDWIVWKADMGALIRVFAKLNDNH